MHTSAEHHFIFCSRWWSVTIKWKKKHFKKVSLQKLSLAGHGIHRVHIRVGSQPALGRSSTKRTSAELRCACRHCSCSTFKVWLSSTCITRSAFSRTIEAVYIISSNNCVLHVLHKKMWIRIIQRCGKPNINQYKFDIMMKIQPQLQAYSKESKQVLKKRRWNTLKRKRG